MFRWRPKLAMWIILGVLCLTACVSIAIQNGESDDSIEVEKDIEIKIGDNDVKE